MRNKIVYFVYFAIYYVIMRVYIRVNHKYVKNSFLKLNYIFTKLNSEKKNILILNLLYINMWLYCSTILY